MYSLNTQCTTLSSSSPRRSKYHRNQISCLCNTRQGLLSLELSISTGHTRRKFALFSGDTSMSEYHHFSNAAAVSRSKKLPGTATMLWAQFAPVCVPQEHLNMDLVSTNPKRHPQSPSSQYPKFSRQKSLCWHCFKVDATQEF